MEIKVLTSEESKKYENEIFQLLQSADEEFVPPLSMRSSTTQKNLSAVKKSVDGVKMYFEGMIKQKILAATENGKLMGFVSYKENFTNDKISEKELPNIYISTLLVSPDGRGRGLTVKMYEKLFSEYEGNNVFTRTWSTNGAHIKILQKLGFENICTIENDRGEGIHTVYFKL